MSGVFNDSSKMYIPAPPSPTPDYDHERLSDGEDSDIPAEPFYVSSKGKKNPVREVNEKTSSSSNRDSLSEDSLQGGTPDTPPKKKQQSTPSKEGNSLQAMMAEFHMGLPPPPTREDGRFSEDSLEEDEEESSMLSPSRPAANDDLQSQRPESMESLISMDGSTTSFDYMSDLHQQRNLDRLKKGSNEALPIKGNERQSNEDKCRKEASPRMKGRENGSKINAERTEEEELITPPVRSDSLNESLSPRDVGRTSAVNGVPKFDTIKNLIKEGLIEGLDETPPDFAPPPPPKMIRSASMIEERVDSGIGSTVSTSNRADESGSSDTPSGRLSSTPPEKSLENSSRVYQRRTSSPPPLPPPRDSSMSTRPTVCKEVARSQAPPLVRNQSWLYKNKKIDPTPNLNSNFGHKNSLQGRCEDANRNFKRNGPNNNLASQYATPQDHRENHLDNHTFQENIKNLHSHKKLNESYSLISDDQASVSSHGSRSGRFFSRFTESMKSGSRTNSPLATKQGKKETKKVTAPKYHGDFIRVPSRIKNEAPQPPLGGKPPEYKNISDPVSVIPLTRDGSGRFRSIEDLAEVSGKSLELRREDDQKKKGKKNSTLPPNLTPADMHEQQKELKRNSSSPGNKGKGKCGLLTH